MNKNLKGAIVVIIIAASAFAYYKLTHSKKRFATGIISLGGYSSPIENLLSFDESYLKNWFKALRNKQETFTDKGSVYLTKGGKTKK